MTNTNNPLAAIMIPLLADTYTLYLKTQNFHWNVEGIHFLTLHAFFEEQYKALAEAADEIAERIRALGDYAPGSYKDFMKHKSIDEANGQTEAKSMLKELIKDHMALVATVKDIMKAADKKEDQVTVDLMVQRQAFHEKTLWMLDSLTK